MCRGGGRAVEFAVLQSMVPGGLTEKVTLSKDQMGRGSAGRSVGQVLGAERRIRKSHWGDLLTMLPALRTPRGAGE